MAEGRAVGDGAAPADAREPLVEIVGVSKRFDATQALDDVSLALHAGEIHALLGENGAGKSTLIKVMTGIYPPDRGSIVMNGEELTLRTGAEAQRYGIAAIYQEPAIFPDVNVDVRALASTLSVAGQQAVEIAKAISLDVRVLIMDEPTAALSAHEVDRLFRQVRDLSARGVAVLFISHRLDEVFELADRVTVLRDGRLISSRSRREATPEQVIRDMVGRDVADFFARSDHAPDETVLRVEDLGRDGAFSGVSFEVRRGEVLGLAGLVGAGRTDVALALFGIAPADTGRVELDGRAIVTGSPGR